MKNYKFILIIILIIFSALSYNFLYRNNADELQVIFLDVGQGDAHLIITPGGQNILIDGGPDNTVLEKLSAYLPFNDRTIDLMILTHPHADHTAGAVEVLRRYEVKRILATGAVHTTDTYLAWLNEIKEQQINVDQALVGKQYKFESDGEPVYLEVLFPDRNIRNEVFDDLNESSVVVMLKYLNKKFLFTGDISVDNEKRILTSYCYPSTSSGSIEDVECEELRSDVLKVAHQGADTSSSEEFLQAVNPQYAVIPVGENDYGHPSLRIVRRLERLPAAVLRTDLAGDVIFKVDPENGLRLIR